ncbi:hypothetical protein DERP_015419 [Dermatophagoides pteronyssinus]|uniref:Uncharacterized protein n=1 Tax=Dermatophagoides pteronyssinus TaxID=6956 RepID=A0ABQ8J1E9_DERPT|nr:hypothetical protein DERP_015419 [Dermatophagoides pteronyssinus]
MGQLCSWDRSEFHRDGKSDADMILTPNKLIYGTEIRKPPQPPSKSSTKMDLLTEWRSKQREINSAWKRIVTVEKNGKPVKLLSNYGIAFDKLGINVFQIAPADIFHDLAEGVISSIIAKVFEILKVKLGSDRVRNRFSSFKIWINGKIVKSNSRKGLAKNRVSLVELFPEMTENPSDYAIYFHLRKVIFFVFSPSAPCIKELRLAVKKFLCSCHEIGLNTPKVHFISHYPELTEFYGTLSRFSTDKYERVHSYLKNLLSLSKNFLNVPYSLSKRNQMAQPKHEPIFLTNLFRTEYKQNYQQFLLDVNWWRYEENMNMQTINRIVPSTIEHCLSVLPNIETNEESKKVLSNSEYYLNQFLELLPTCVSPVHEQWPSKNLQSTSPLKFSWVQPSEICDKIILNNKFIISQLLNETSCNFDQLKYTEHLKCDINRRKQLMGELIGYNRAEMKRSHYELKDVLKPLIDDLKFIMEEGIEKKITDINGQTITKKFKIAVSAVCGDNKGIYELLGDYLLLNDVQDYQGPMAIQKSLEEYNEELRLLTTNKKYVSPFGIRKPSAFASLKINLYQIAPVDPFHDFAMSCVVEWRKNNKSIEKSS